MACPCSLASLQYGDLSIFGLLTQGLRAPSMTVPVNKVEVASSYDYGPASEVTQCRLCQTLLVEAFTIPPRFKERMKLLQGSGKVIW